MKKNLVYIKLLITLIFFVMFFSVTVSSIFNKVYAENVNFKSNKENLIYELFNDLDIESFYQYGEKVIDEYPYLTENEQNALMKKHAVRLISQNRTSEIKNNSNKSNYNGKFTKAEIKLIIRHPIKATKVNTAKKHADNKTNNYYERKVHYLDNGDAFRHGLWNALMTKYIGRDWAKKFADAHEYGVSQNSESEKLDVQMDYINNEKGRSYGDIHKKKGEDQIAVIIRNAISNGEFVKCIYTINSEGKYIATSHVKTDRFGLK